MSPQSLTLKNSDAFADELRLLSQHQAIVTIVQQRLDDPALKNFLWLDIGCGPGQVLSQLEHNIGAKGRTKVKYFGFDANGDYLRTVTENAKAAAVACEVTI